MARSSITGIDSGTTPIGLRQPELAATNIQERFQQVPEVGGDQLGRGLRRGVATITSAGQSLLGAGAAVLGADEFAQEQTRQASERVHEAVQANPLRIERVEDISTDNFGDFLSDTEDFIVGLTGQQLPVLGALALGGGAGGAAIRGLTGASRAASAAGGVVGASSGLETGLIFQEIAEDPGAEGSLRDQALLSAAGGTLAGSLDALPVLQVANRMGLGRSLQAQVRRSLASRVTRGAAATGVTEAGTEAAQTVIERATRHVANENFEILGPEGVSELLNAAVAGGIIGVGLGGLSGVPRPAGTPSVDADSDLELSEEVEAIEVAEEQSILLAKKRIEELRGTIPDDVLNQLNQDAEVFADEDLFNQIDSLTPPEFAEIRDSRELIDLEELAESDPQEAVLKLLDEVNLSREAGGSVELPGRRATIFAQAMSNLTRQDPELAREILIDNVSAETLDEFEGSEFGEIVEDQAQIAEEQEIFDEGDTEFEEGEDVLNFNDVKTALPAPGRIHRAANGSSFFLSAERLAEVGIEGGGVEAQLKKLEEENPNEIFELLDAREVVTDNLINKHGPRGPENEALFARDELAVARFQEATRTSVGLPSTFNEADPLTSLDGQFAIRRSRVSQKLDTRDEEELTDEDLRPGLSDFEKQRKTIAKRREGADKKAIDERFNDIALRRSILRDVQKNGRLRNTSEFFVTNPSGKKKVIFGPKLTRKMINRMRFNTGQRIRGHVFPAEASRAFLVAMESLKIAGFDLKSIPKTTVIFKAKRKGEVDMTVEEAVAFEQLRTEEALLEPLFPEEESEDINEFEGSEFNDFRQIKEFREAGRGASNRLANQMKLATPGIRQAVRDAVRRHIEVESTPESVRAVAFEAARAAEIMQYSVEQGEAIFRSLGVAPSIPALARNVLNNVKDSDQRAAHIGLVRDWAQLLGIKARVLDVEEAVDYLLAQNDYARLRGILNGSLHGFSLANGRLFVNPQLRSDMQVEVLAHETGHVVFKQTVPKDFDAVHEAWDKWRQEFDRPGARVNDVNASKQRLRAAIAGAYNHNNLTLDVLSDADRQYLLDFEEWFADQTSLWLTQPNSKPRDTTEGWFANFVSAMRKIFGSLTKGEVITDQQAERFLNERVGSFVARATRNQPHVDARVADSRVIQFPDNKFEQRRTIIEIQRLSKKKDDDDIADSRTLDVRTEEARIEDAREAAREFILAATIEADPMSDVSHTAIRHFINEVNTPEEKRALGIAFTKGSVRRQMNHHFRNHPEVLQRMDGSVIEAIAYGYQLWTAGEIEVGPTTKGIFGEDLRVLKRAAGFITQRKQAEQILVQMQQQTFDIDRLMSQGSAFDVKVSVRETVLQNIAQYANEMYDTWAKPWFDRIFVGALSRMMDSRNPALQQLAIRAHTPPNTQGRSEGYLAAKETERVKFQRDMTAATNGTTDQEVLKSIWRALMLNEATGSAEQDHMVSEIRKRIGDIYNYATRKGLRMEERENYFPWVYDREYLQGHKDEFIELMLRPVYRPFMNEIAREYAESFRSHQEKIADYNARFSSDPNTPPPQFTKYERRTLDIVERFGFIDNENVAEIIYESITDADGYSDAELDFSRASHTPFVRALNVRTLDFLLTKGDTQDREDFLKFFNQDFDYTIRTYIDQVVKRAEYTDSFNAVEREDGVVVSDVERLLEEAEELGATPEQLRLAHDFVNSIQGTHGARTSQLLGTLPMIGDKIGSKPEDTMQIINPRLQMINSWLIVWQNFRVLGLATLTSLADPVGIAVRGGSADTVMASIRALSKDSKAREIAEKLGIIHTHTINEMLGSLYSNNFMTAASQATNEKFFKWIGLSALTKATRIMGTGAALEFIRSHSQSDTTQSKRFLAELNLEAADVVLDEQSNIVIRTRPEMDALWDAFERGPSQGDPTILAEIEREERLRKALNRFVDEAILRPNAANRPIWASDPHFAIFFHLKSFIYTFHNQILRRVYNEAVRGNYVPVAMLFIYVPFMIMADLLRDIARFGFEGNPRKSRWNVLDYTGTAIQRAGLPGLSTFMLDAEQDREFGGTGYESFLGPTASFTGDIDDIMFNNDQGTYQALLDQLPFQNTFVIEGIR